MTGPGFYESERALSEYLLFHYGSRAQVLPWASGPADALEYPARCVSECLDVELLPDQARALDLGCAVGRASFELARHCPEVIGIDASQRFIEAARQLQKHGSLCYNYVEEGLVTTAATATVPAEIDRERVQFHQGDALALPPNLGTFDAMLLANLLDRLPDPLACLQTLPNLLRKGGQLILTTPCTWTEDYTPRSHWLGGIVIDGRPMRTAETLARLLMPQLTLVRTLDLPFLLREHARKFQWSVALATVWVRK
jgi:putative 4-mercaptohistidine N1-methyltranferase